MPEKLIIEPVYSNGMLADIQAEKNGRKILMLGTGGIKREISVIDSYLQNCRDHLPVFLGTGIGTGLKNLLQSYEGPVAVIDKEDQIKSITKVFDSLPDTDKKRIFIITDKNKDEALKLLADWQRSNGSKPLSPVAFSFYQRINPDYYGFLRKHIETMAKKDCHAKPVIHRFSQNKLRVLLLASKYFLIGEIENACKRLKLDYKLIMAADVMDASQFVKQLMQEVISFKPDCAITLNHMGLDREGVLMNIFERLNLPLASWFVDNPHLIIHNYRKNISPWATLFTWDYDNLETLRQAGFENVYYLPLGTNIARFKPGQKGPKAWKSRVSFVGNSMYYKVGLRMKAGQFKKPLLMPYKKIAKTFLESSCTSVSSLLKNNYPDVYNNYLALPGINEKCIYDTLITWEATKLYRNNCTRRLLPFNPLIVGDKGWNIEFKRDAIKPRLMEPISYYDELPLFYGMSEINFNCTSRQMTSSVNQRVFDVPASGAFVLTDWNTQLENLFEPDEMVFYKEPEEISSLVKFYLDHPQEREKIAAKGRKRVLAHHKWENRIKEMLAVMQKIYGTKVIAS